MYITINIRAPASVYTFYYSLILAIAITLIAMLLADLGFIFVIYALYEDPTIGLDGGPHLPRLDDGVLLVKNVCIITFCILTFIFTFAWNFIGVVVGSDDDRRQSLSFLTLVESDSPSEESYQVHPEAEHSWISGSTEQDEHLEGSSTFLSAQERQESSRGSDGSDTSHQSTIRRRSIPPYPPTESTSQWSEPFDFSLGSVMAEPLQHLQRLAADAESSWQWPQSFGSSTISLLAARAEHLHQNLMADATAQEQHRSEPFDPFQPSPEEEQSSLQRPQSLAPLPRTHDRNRRSFNLYSLKPLPPREEQSSPQRLGSPSPLTSIPDRSRRSFDLPYRTRPAPGAEQSPPQRRAFSTLIASTKVVEESSESSCAAEHESPEDAVVGYSMEGLEWLDRWNDETHLAGGNDETQLAEGNSSGRASVGLPGPVAESSDPRTEDIQAAEQESILASSTVQCVDSIIDEVSSWEGCALTKQSLRERLVFKYDLQIPSSDEIDEECAKLEYFSVKRKMMGSQKFSVYGRADLLEHSLLKCWVYLNQHYGAGLWPKDYRPKYATLKGEWRADEIDESRIKRFEDDDASCVTESTFVSER